MGAFNSLEFLKSGVVFWRIFPMLPSQMQPEGRVGLGHIEKALIQQIMVAGVVPPITFLLTIIGVLFSQVLYEVVTLMNSSIIGVLSACGACTTPVLMIKASWLFAPILGLVGGSNTGTSSCLILIFWLTNKIWWEIPTGLPANWTCTSLAFALFESFLTFFIVKFVDLSIRLFPT